MVGSQRALAQAVGLGQTAISNWIKRGSTVPAEHCAAIETATAGAVTRRDLRPNDWQDIWPELAQPSAALSFAATDAVAQGVANV